MSFFAYGNRSLSVKFLLPLVLTTILILVAGGILLRIQVENDLESQTEITVVALQTEQKSSAESQRNLLESKADIIGKFLVETSAEFLLSYDYMTVQSLKEIAETDGEITYALFLNPDGTTIDGTPVPPEKDGIIRKSYPIRAGAEEIGTVLIGLSQARMQAQLAESEQRAREVQGEVKALGKLTLDGLTSTMGFTYLLLLVISVLMVSTLFRRMVVQPLNRMAGVIEKMGRGQLDGRLKMTRVDEIGRISLCMDEMAEKLENTVRRIDGSTGELVKASGSINDVSRQVNDSGTTQAQGVAETHSAIQVIDQSSKQITARMGGLAEAAETSTSSILEMSSSIEEVAENADALAATAAEVGSSIGEIAASIRQIADSADMMLEVADSTMSSVVQVDTSVNEVESATKETAAITENVKKDAELGKSSVEAVISGMGQIRSASETVSEAVGALSTQAEKIGSVLGVINEVTDETNLLALNAAIIAAQAGEHGRGFGVVAQEIRDLADRTGASTKEIAAMVEAVQEQTEKVVNAIRQAEENIGEGETLSVRSGEALTKIVEGIRDVDQRMERITRTTLEQSQGTKLIREAMDKVSTMIDQTTTAIQEQKKAADLIQSAAENMNQMADRVSGSTREQSEASKWMVKTVETINDMAQEINRACEEQHLKSSQIMQVVEKIRQSSDNNIESTRILRQAVETQNQQIIVLKEEVNFFQVTR